MVKFSRIGGEEKKSNLPSTGLIINGAVWVKHLYHVHNKSQTIYFGVLEVILLWKTTLVCHPEDRTFWTRFNRKYFRMWQSARVECNMWCSNMVLTNPHMKPRIEFIINSVHSHLGLRYSLIEVYPSTIVFLNLCIFANLELAKGTPFLKW